MGKEDFRREYPLGMCCVEREELAEMHMSSGSTGTPVVMPYTLADLDQWAECMARCYAMARCAAARTRFRSRRTRGSSTGGFGLFPGARKYGMFIVPAGPGNTVRQIKLARDFKKRGFSPRGLLRNPIMEVMEEEKSAMPDLEIGIFGAETFSDAMKQAPPLGLGIEVFRHLRHDRTGGIGDAWHGLRRPLGHPRVGGSIHH